MAQPARCAATYADLVAASDLLIAEIIFGRLVTHRRGDLHHNLVLTALSIALEPIFSLRTLRPQSLFGLRRVEVHIGPHVIVPDIAAWRLRRIRPLLETDYWIDLAPEWACEVLSPETADRDRGEKKVVYAKAGVRHLWLVDPAIRTLETFELRNGKWLLLDVFSDNAQVTAAPFAELSFALSVLWKSGAQPSVPPAAPARKKSLSKRMKKKREPS